MGVDTAAVALLPQIFSARLRVMGRSELTALLLPCPGLHQHLGCNLFALASPSQKASHACVQWATRPAGHLMGAADGDDGCGHQ